MKEWYLAKFLLLWYCELPHVVSLYLKVVCKCNWWCCCHLITLSIVESLKNNLFQVSFLFLIPTFFLISLFFLVVVLKLLSFGLSQQGFGLWMSFLMLFFIYKFCQLKWWCSNQLVVWILHYYKLHQQLVSRKRPCHHTFFVILPYFRKP